MKNLFKKRSDQQGVAAVELIIVASVLLTGIFAVIEIGRLFSYFNTLSEATRRGARAAAVCPPFGPSRAAVGNLAVFDSPTGGGTSALIDLTTSNIKIEYLSASDTDADGNLDVLLTAGSASPNADADTLANACAAFADIELVRVSIDPPADFEWPLAIPFMDVALGGLPTFSTTLPVESLGYSPAHPLIVVTGGADIPAKAEDTLECYGLAPMASCCGQPSFPACPPPPP